MTKTLLKSKRLSSRPRLERILRHKPLDPSDKKALQETSNFLNLSKKDRDILVARKARRRVGKCP